MINSITVKLYERTETGKDELGEAIYQEQPIYVPGVLVTPASADAIVSDLQLYGRRSVYELCIPKGDAHEWEGCRVEFFGKVFRAFTPLERWIESNVPLRWNAKIRVERYE